MKFTYYIFPTTHKDYDMGGYSYGELCCIGGKPHSLRYHHTLWSTQKELRSVMRNSTQFPNETLILYPKKSTVLMTLILQLKCKGEK